MLVFARRQTDVMTKEKEARNSQSNVFNEICLATHINHLHTLKYTQTTKVSIILRTMNENNKNSRKHNRTITKTSKSMHAIPKMGNVPVVHNTIYHAHMY